MSTNVSTALTALRRVEHCMGTVFTFDIRPPGVDESVVDHAVRWLHWVDATFSTYRADSQISRLGRGELNLRDCSAHVRTVLSRCRELEAESCGYFSAYPAGHLDPSGYVKGWAIERVSDLLVAAGSTNHSVNGCGDVQCVGQSAAGQPWRIGITHPHHRADLIAIVVGTGADLAVATSGTAERGHHVLDPHTACAPVGLASLSVSGPRLAEADAYATAAFAMGTDALDWLEQLDGYHGFVVASDGTTRATCGWAHADEH